jgi:hypothetical protein
VAAARRPRFCKRRGPPPSPRGKLKAS